MNPTAKYILISFGVLLGLAVIIVIIIISLVIAEITSPVDISQTWEEALKMYENSNKLDMVVSLTTLPGRLQKSIQPTLISLLVQNPAPAKIRMNIPHVLKRKNKKYEIPLWLENNGAIEIHRVPDYGPSTKYLSTLQDYSEEKDKTILIVDDDIIFPPGAINTIFAEGNKYPDKVVSGHGSILDKKGTKQVNFKANNFVEPTKSIFGWLVGSGKHVNKKDDFSQVDTIFGYQGYIIRPKFFDMEKLMDYELMPKEAFFVDDLVISGNLAEKNIDRIVVKNWPKLKMELQTSGEFIRSLFLPQKSDESLALTENRHDQSNNTIVAQYFWEHWK